MLLKINERMKEARENPDSGAAILTVMILSVFVFAMLFASLTTLASTSKITANNRSSVNTLLLADTGVEQAMQKLATSACTTSSSGGETDKIIYTVYRTDSATPPLTKDAPGVVEGCPQDGDRFFIIEAKGTDARGKNTSILATYQWLNRNAGLAEGAMVSGGGTMNLSSLIVVGDDADLVLLQGNFNCNNITEVGGDLIVLGGEVDVSNECRINGSIYSVGRVKIDNPAVAVGGDIYTLGNFSISTGVTVAGSVYSKGSMDLTSGAKINGSILTESTNMLPIDNVQIGGNVVTAGTLRIGSNTRIGGNVVSSNTGASDFYTANIDGNVTIGGYFSQFAESKIKGSVIAALPGTASSIAPSTTIDGSLHTGGAINTWGAGPTVPGGKFPNSAGLASPSLSTWTIPDQLYATNFPWTEYTYIPEDWASEGYTVLTKASCDYQNNIALVNELNALTTPTILDMRGCSPQMYGVQFKVKTDIMILTNGIANAEQLSVTSADGNNHQFDIITPDPLDNNIPTCDSGLSEIDIYGAKFEDKITSFIYTPCSLKIGGASTIQGQLYFGGSGYSAGGSMVLTYVPSPMPGWPSTEEENAAGYEVGVSERLLPRLVARSEP